MQQQSKGSPIAWPRVVVWALLALFSVYTGVGYLTGNGRDSEFKSLPWGTDTYIELLVIVALFAGLYGRAAYVTYTREVAPPTPGTLRFSGAKLNGFGEVFLTLVGALLMLLATWMLIGLPEVLLASNSEQYRHYASAAPVPHVMMSSVFGGIGFVLLILRRYVWEKQPGKPLRRYTARAFGRGREITQPLGLYFGHYYQKTGQYTRTPIARWLRAEDPTSKGFFRDADLEMLPLHATPDELSAAAARWTAVFAQAGIQSGPSAVALRE